jgi:hypothetical protein
MALEPFAFQERLKTLEVAGRIAQLSFFFLRRSFFESSAHAATRMSWTGRIFWLLAFGAVDSFKLIVDRPAVQRLLTIN